jgi:hypothetical protein
MRDIAALASMLAHNWFAMDPLSRASLVAAVIDPDDPTFATAVEHALGGTCAITPIELSFDDLE